MQQDASPRAHNWRRDRITRARDTFVSPRVRREILEREPVCRVCKARPATEIDHIRPVCEGGDSDHANLQPIDRQCHLTKTSLEANRMRWHVHKIGRRHNG